MKVGYLPGDTHKIVTKDNVIATDNAAVSGDGVQINAGGSATFGFSTRFAMSGVTLKFEGASGTTTITTIQCWHHFSINNYMKRGHMNMKRDYMKKIIALIITAMILLSIVPASVFASAEALSISSISSPSGILT